MGTRLELQTLLESVLGSDQVYFQPPSGFMMKYPCIVYHRIDIPTRFADNLSYKIEHKYSVTVIDANPDSDIPDKVKALPRCVYDRQFTPDNLYHDVFNITF